MLAKSKLFGFLRESVDSMDSDRRCRLKAIAFLYLLGLAVCGVPVWAQAPLTTIYMPQGGKIVYGKVEGADSQGAAMTTILRSLHENFGDKPQIGKVFRMRGTDSVGVFFTVLNRPAGNLPVGGLIIAANSKPHEAQAALVWDRSDHLAQSINPMLDRLFGEWHPGGVEAGPGASTGRPAAPAPAAAASRHAAPAGKLHRVTASDQTTSTEIPDGWTMDPRSGEGTMVITGPNGEFVGMGMKFFAIDPTNPNQVRSPRTPGMLYFPYRGDIVKDYPELVQAWRRAANLPPLKLEGVQVKQPPAIPGASMNCASAAGHMDTDGKGMRKYGDLMCASRPGDWGVYMVTLSRTVVPIELAEREDKDLHAINDSWKVDFALVKQQADAAAQRMQANTQEMIRRNQQRTREIQQFGENTVAHMKEVQHEHDVQNRGFEQREEDISRRGQGFSNYILDQTVIRDVQDPGTHATVWNRTADSLMKAYPDRVEEVPTSQYIKGTDF